MIFFSKTTGGFYPGYLRGVYEGSEAWPDDAVEVSSEVEAAIRAALANGDTVNSDLTITPKPPTTIDELRAVKNEEINAARLAANATTFPFAGKLISCDQLSRGDIDAVQGKVARSGTFPAGFPGGWKATDNTIIPLTTVADWDAFYDAMAAQGTENFNHSQDLKAQLAAAATPEQVAAIVW